MKEGRGYRDEERLLERKESLNIYKYWRAEYKVEEFKGSAELYQNSNPNWISLIRPGLCWEKLYEFPVKDSRYRETNHSRECYPAEQGGQHLQVLRLRHVEEGEGSEEKQE